MTFSKFFATVGVDRELLFIAQHNARYDGEGGEVEPT